MGDRAQVKFVYPDKKEVYFYTHWGGYCLKDDVINAIKRGADRWEDEEYLARIIFSEMIQNNVLEETGFGIGFEMHGDLSHPVIIVDSGDMTVDFGDGVKIDFRRIK
jgi:hypothetical protein